MKFITAVLLLLSVNVFAQTVPPSDSDDDMIQVAGASGTSQEQAQGEEYRVTGTSSVVDAEGQEFSKIDLEKVTEKDPNHHIDLDRALLAVDAVSVLAAGYGVWKWNPEQDKVRHILAGYVIGNGVNGAFQLFLPKDMEHRKLISALAGFGAAVLIGIGKEVRDSMGYGTPSVKDAAATALGGIGGTLTISIVDVQNAFRRKHAVVPVQ